MASTVVVTQPYYLPTEIELNKNYLSPSLPCSEMVVEAELLQMQFNAQDKQRLQLTLI